MQNAGMSPKQVLQSATTLPAAWLGSNTGIMLSGKKPNLLMLDGNPLNDIKNTKKINTVFLAGRILERDLLDGILNSVKEANDSSRKKSIEKYK